MGRLRKSAGCEVLTPRESHPLKQRMACTRLAMLLKAAGDPDAEGLTAFARGVRLGVGVRMPRLPGGSAQ